MKLYPYGKLAGKGGQKKFEPCGRGGGGCTKSFGVVFMRQVLAIYRGGCKKVFTL